MIDLSGIKVVSDAEAETAEFVVCMPLGAATPFRDNQLAVCCACGQPIIHRPYAPRRPRKICMPCMVRRIEAERR